LDTGSIARSSSMRSASVSRGSLMVASKVDFGVETGALPAPAAPEPSRARHVDEPWRGVGLVDFTTEAA
jgi:hypothetical protein